MKQIVSFPIVSFIVCSLLFSFTLNAQQPGCPDANGDVYITSQAQINAFKTNCGNQSLGVLFIDGTDIKNLDGLNEITSVSALYIWGNPLLTSISGLSAVTSVGSLMINNNASLTNTNGFNALTAINENLEITNNRALTTVSGFNALTLAGKFGIYNNNVLTTISGFDALKTVTGSFNILNLALTTISGFGALTSCRTFEIDGSPVLTTLSGFGVLTNVVGQFTISGTALTNLPNFGALTTIASTHPGSTILDISNNPNLTDLNGLSALKTIGVAFIIDNNAGLTSLSGLSSLQSIGSDFYISSNLSLTSLNGLSALTTFNHALHIDNNNVLTSLHGLDNITQGSVTYLFITGNSQLSDCATKLTCGYLQKIPSQPYSINNNLAGCNSGNEILASCSALPVELISFSGKKVAGYNVLDWRTATEINNSGFDVERGNGVSAFEKIGFVSGAGNSSVMLSYSFTDKNPLSGVNYYRLKQINNDGKFTYSNIIDVENPDTGSFGIFPNPGSDKVYVQGMIENTAYNITNIQGQILQSGVLLHNQTVNVSALPQGLYFLRTASQTAKFVKQNSN